MMQQHLGRNLPKLLIEFAAYSKSFSSFSLGLGEDYEKEFAHQEPRARDAPGRFFIIPRPFIGLQG